MPAWAPGGETVEKIGHCCGTVVGKPQLSPSVENCQRGSLCSFVRCASGLTLSYPARSAKHFREMKVNGGRQALHFFEPLLGDIPGDIPGG